MLNTRALLLATVLGTVLQVAMVVAGHSNKSIAALFAIGGMGFSLIAGLAYAMWARGGSPGALALGGLSAGAICAFIGILISHLLGDVPATLLLLGTASSAVTGAIGGWLGRFLFRAAIVAMVGGLVVGVPSRSEAQSTAPVGTTRDFTWLVGRWEGRMSDSAMKNAVADVTFAPPVAGLITGVMRLVNGQQVLVVELITMVDTPTGLEMRFRHFSPALEAYEPQFKQAMRLTAHSAQHDVFENATPYDRTLMSTQPRVSEYRRIDADTFVAHSDIIGDDGKPGVVEVRYHRTR